MNKKVKNIILLFGIMLILFSTSAFIMYKYSQYKSHSNLLSEANKYMVNEDYDNAIKLFGQSLEYKKDTNIQLNLQIAQKLKSYKELYNNGLKLLNDKRYLEAIDIFNKIRNDGQKWYSQSQEKINKCKKQYISENINLAKNSDYENANKYLDNILKIDNKNEEALKLRDNLAKNKEGEKRQIAENKQNNSGKQENIVSNRGDNNSNKQHNKSSNELNSLNNQFNILESKLKHTPKGSEEYRNILREQEEIIKQRMEIE